MRCSTNTRPRHRDYRQRVDRECNVFEMLPTRRCSECGSCRLRLRYPRSERIQAPTRRIVPIRVRGTWGWASTVAGRRVSPILSGSNIHVAPHPLLHMQWLHRTSLRRFPPTEARGHSSWRRLGCHWHEETVLSTHDLYTCATLIVHRFLSVEGSRVRRRTHDNCDRKSQHAHSCQHKVKSRKLSDPASPHFDQPNRRGIASSTRATHIQRTSVSQ